MNWTNIEVLASDLLKNFFFRPSVKRPPSARAVIIVIAVTPNFALRNGIFLFSYAFKWSTYLKNDA